MTRRPRHDEPGSWHHVFNRAVARRTMFERADDYRFFLSQLARAVRRGHLSVHAYCLMGTHYHLLLSSPNGTMAEGMQGIQLAYSRWFNRSRRRDGPLVRGRYGSRVVRSLHYRMILVTYLDANAVSGRLTSARHDYPWGSARHYVASSAGPPWLNRTWIDGLVEEGRQLGEHRAKSYERAFPPLEAESMSGLVLARMQATSERDSLDSILDAADPGTQHWMTRKALLADGTEPGLPLASAALLDRALRASEHRFEVRTVGRRRRDERLLVRVGLARDLCGLTFARLAGELDCSSERVRRLYAEHRQALEAGGAYADRVAHVARTAVCSLRVVTEPGSDRRFRPAQPAETADPNLVP